ncbi:Dihydrodipicolinate synthase [Arcticibacter svalbardensis MN12-7]|uniref:4-hydroxy-tetrahydrodipicolinate synthase n=1 Tax=Arcticibacter svalbardensis MN12-7 TaxID=1150600 RepID=R9GW11_9SPHI|nr:4-hydroxy-tetrahydrodipicolinate synthase [Arcticibacter svalbardensis]EOR93109.1 Dihydrodipicolinate synthase [Arcticibacter svalbardensis MN12-7]
MNKFHGTGVAMVTPFDQDGSIDFQGLKKLINFQIDGGVDYLVSLGTTGESATLTKEEKKSVWKFTAEIINGRVPLIAGLGGNNTREVVEGLKQFDPNGYDAILSVSPFYNKPTQEGIYQHYKVLAQESPLPLFIYNVPGRTGSNVAAETTIRLANECKNIIGVKEASGNIEQFYAILRNKPKEFLCISGDDALTLPLIAMGGNGIISVAGNAIPRLFSNMVRLCLKGDFKQAAPLNLRLTKFISLLFEEGNPGGVKSALQHLGICTDHLRLPLYPVGQTTSLAIKKELENLV